MEKLENTPISEVIKSKFFELQSKLAKPDSQIEDIRPQESLIPDVSLMYCRAKQPEGKFILVIIKPEDNDTFDYDGLVDIDEDFNYEIMLYKEESNDISLNQSFEIATLDHFIDYYRITKNENIYNCNFDKLPPEFNLKLADLITSSRIFAVS